MVPAFFVFPMISFVLASESPRRRTLLALAGFPFVVQVAGVDESRVTIADPAQNSLETARLKAYDVATRLAKAPRTGHGRALILAADTTVALGQEMLGKPADADAARCTLAALRGHAHAVHTGMILLDSTGGQEATAVHTAVVTMRPYSAADVEAYIASGEPFDKAGAYAIQDRGFQPVAALDGCFLGVMGLSICQLHLLLPQLGIAPRTDLAALATAHNGYPCPLLQKIAEKESK